MKEQLAVVYLNKTVRTWFIHTAGLRTFRRIFIFLPKRATRQDIHANAMGAAGCVRVRVLMRVCGVAMCHLR